MIWIILSSLGGVAVHILMKIANARKKEDFKLQEFIRLNWIQYTASIAGAVISSVTIPGVTWIQALGIGYMGGSVSKNTLKSVERSIKNGN